MIVGVIFEHSFVVIIQKCSLVLERLAYSIEAFILVSNFKYQEEIVKKADKIS